MIVCVCVCICMYVYICVCMYVYIYIYIYIYITKYITILLYHYMHHNRGYGTIQHIHPYLYQNRICSLQTAPSENTHIHSD